MGYLINGLSFNTLRAANTKRIPLFKNRKGEVAHSEENGSDWTPAQWLQAVVGEVGEYANLRKKFERGDITKEEFDIEAKKELADIVCYLDILALQLDINLGEAVREKFNEVSERMGCDIIIGSDDDWHYSTESQSSEDSSKRKGKHPEDCNEVSTCCEECYQGFMEWIKTNKQ